MRDEDGDPLRVFKLDGEDSFFSYPILLMTSQKGENYDFLLRSF